MTKEQFNISRSNRAKARKYFGLTSNDGYDLHHVNPYWRENDIERYIKWNPEDLIVLTHAEHTKIHSTGRKLSKEAREKISKANLGNTKNLGKQYSLESRIKMSKNHADVSGKNNPMYGKHSNKGQHWKLVDGVRVYY